MQRLVKIISKISYWAIVLLPLAMVISTGMMNTFIGLVVISWLLKKLLEGKWDFVKTPVALPFLFFILMALVSFCNSIDYRASIKGMEKLFKYGLLFLACAQEIREVKHLKRIIVSVALVIILVSLDGLWQLILGADFIHGRALLSCGIDLPRVTASFSSPNAMGIYLACFTPLLFGLAFFHLKGRLRIFIGLASVLGMTGIFLTFSGGAAIGLIGGILFLAIVRRHKVVLVMILALFLAGPFILPENLKDWARKVNYNPLEFVCGPGRVTIYANSMNMIRQHPVIGFGVNTFSKNYAKYKLAEMEKYAATSDTMYAHNNFLHMAGEVGLVGLGIFIWFLVALFKNGWQVYRRSGDDFLKITALSLIACIIAFLINGLTETSLYNQIGICFWFITGLLLCLNKISQSEGAI